MVTSRHGKKRGKKPQAGGDHWQYLLSRGAINEKQALAGRILTSVILELSKGQIKSVDLSSPYVDATGNAPSGNRQQILASKLFEAKNFFTAWAAKVTPYQQKVTLSICVGIPLAEKAPDGKKISGGGFRRRKTALISALNTAVEIFAPQRLAD